MGFMLPGKILFSKLVSFVLACTVKNTAIFCETMSKFPNKSQRF